MKANNTTPVINDEDISLKLIMILYKQNLISEAVYLLVKSRYSYNTPNVA